MNKVILLGNLGKDAELRFTQQQKPVSSFSVATSEKHKDKEVTDWHSVTMWGERAEKLNQYLKKGQKVLVEGALKTKSWQDKAGQKRYETYVLAFNIELLGGKPQQSRQSYQPQEPNAPSQYPSEPPF